MSTALGEKIKAIIEANGPISVTDFFSLCLADPEYGYYRTREPFGRTGDFVTAPEVSQLFGEMIGVFVCGYALSRIFVEFFREPDAQLGYLLGTNWLTMGMVLSTPMVLLGIWAMLRARRQAALQH